MLKDPSTTYPPAAKNRFTPRLIVAFLAFMLAASGFTFIAHKIREGDTLHFDTSVLLLIHRHASPLLDHTMIAITNIGGLAGTVSMTALIVGVLWVRRRKVAALMVACGVGGAAVISVVMKSLFDRTRPDLWAQLVHETSFSFPSGHAMASAALALSLMAVFWRTKWRPLVVTLGTVYIILIGFTRLYLGVHYPTDIMGGWLLSLAWVVLVAWLITRYVELKQRA
jgi:undecaprenyl-diphosphatase